MSKFIQLLKEAFHELMFRNPYYNPRDPRGSWIFIILLVVIGIVSVVYMNSIVSKFNRAIETLSTSTPSSFKNFGSDTSSWQTYRNEEYGFELKYPNEFELRTQTEREKSQIGENQRCIAKRGKDFCKLLINSFDLSRYKLSDQSAAMSFKYDAIHKQWVHDTTNETSKFVPQRVGTSVEAYLYKTGDIKCNVEYILIPNIILDRLIEIENITCSDDNGKVVEGYENIDSSQILSTFRFTEDTEINEWQVLIPDITAVLRQTFPKADSDFLTNGKVTIYKEKDITGDGVPEALVDTGFHGANTSFYSLMTIKNGKPVTTLIKDRNGKVFSDYLFGRGGGVSTGLAFDFLPADNAIFQGNSRINFDTGVYTTCEVEAYKWNANTEMFEFNVSLSDRIKPNVCSLPEMNG